jgi:DNA-binding NarL/FixJ family response regulator
VSKIEHFDWRESCQAFLGGGHFMPSPEVILPITVLLADDSDAMRSAIVNLLSQEPNTELVGEAKGFAQTIQLANALKPDILLMDLHMSDEREYPPESVKVQLSIDAGCVLALSLWNDENAKALAERFGARVLLDKANLYSELISAIKQNCPPGA